MSFLPELSPEMSRLFQSKSCSLNSMPPPLYEDDEGYFRDFNTDGDGGASEKPATTPFLSPGDNSINEAHFSSVLGVVAAALRKSLVTCSVDTNDVASDVDIGWPTDVRHVSHVTFDRFNGFLGLPSELQPDVPRKPPSASASVFGVSAQSMQCSLDQRGNSVPTILLRMQNRLYSEGGLQAEGVFRINAENSEEEDVRKQLNRGVVPHGIDVHCLSGLIKAWFRELPSGVLDCLTPEQVMHCNTEEECSEVVKLLPPTEAALLDWAINLMADVVHHQHHNKMNARNIAMVFAPNMTQMADPLTTLIHAVQVMNFLKTLIGKTLAQRQESTTTALFTECGNAQVDQAAAATPTSAFDQSSYSSSIPCKETETETARSRSRSKSDVGEKRRKRPTLKDEYDSINMAVAEAEAEAEAEEGILNRLSLRRGMQKLCRHPVFHLTKKTGRGFGFVL